MCMQYKSRSFNQILSGHEYEIIPFVALMIWLNFHYTLMESKELFKFIRVKYI